ncbi:hypothetical protein BGZ73_001191 [Actinomortierella ambigua]|nr:hypothetical protein BGZ73_001191 [Actinomortierella ambigua]
MTTKGWRVVQCSGEADVEIAKVCSPTDIVVSRDSDFFAYQSVDHIWRPMGYGNRSSVARYHISDILATLQLTRSQLTAMCIVTTNDYSANVPSLGISNYSLIKNINGGMPIVFSALAATDIVDNYLQLSSVKLKNKNGQLFLNSIKVFIGLQQTPVQLELGRDDSNLLEYRSVQKEFERMCALSSGRRKHRVSKASATHMRATPQIKAEV